MDQEEVSKAEEDTQELEDLDSEERLTKLNKKYGWLTLFGGFFLHAVLG